MTQLLEKYKALFTSAPWYIRALLMIGVPLLLLGLAYLKISQYVSNISDFLRQKNATDQDQKLTQDIQQQQQKATAVDAELQKLDQQAAAIPGEVKDQDPVAFHNARPTEGEPK